MNSKAQNVLGITYFPLPLYFSFSWALNWKRLLHLDGCNLREPLSAWEAHLAFVIMSHSVASRLTCTYTHTHHASVTAVIANRFPRTCITHTNNTPTPAPQIVFRFSEALSCAFLCIFYLGCLLFLASTHVTADRQPVFPLLLRGCKRVPRDFIDFYLISQRNSLLFPH